jgi:hypothetical protein
MKTKNGAKLCSAILIVVLFPCTFCSVVKAQDDYYHQDFRWSYNGSEWTLSLDIPKSTYELYKNVPVSNRLNYPTFGYSYLTTTNDAYLKMVAEKLEEVSSREGYGSYDEVGFVLAFIQSLPYTSDSVTSDYDEYARFPLETLVDNGGDCEDTSILFATLTLIMGYGTVYINPPDHYAVGVLGENLPGSYYVYNGKTYYYCETAGDGWEIGGLPSEYRNAEVTIYEINVNEQCPHSVLNPGFVPSFDVEEFLRSPFLWLIVISIVIAVVSLDSWLRKRK